MPGSHFELPPTFQGEVRLFPLPKLVMFPGNALPLRIFESRYKEMMEDALQGDQLITIATLLPGYDHDYYSRPPIAPVVCIGRISAHEKTADGMYELMLVGLRRARIEQEIEPVRSFRRARVELLGEDQLPDEPTSSRLGRKLADRLLKTLPAAQELVDQFFQGGISLASLADVMAFHLPLDLERKLELLAEVDVRKRADLLLANLSPMDEPGRESRPYPADFSDN